MKKYFAGIFAIVFALALYSFTGEKSQVNEDRHYWFEYDENGLGAQIGSGMLTKSEAESLSCVDVPGEDCARAYASATNPESVGNPPLDFITTDQP